MMSQIEQTLAYHVQLVNDFLVRYQDLPWIHLSGDAVIALSYFLIFIACIYFFAKRTDLRHGRVLILFALFSFLAAVLHLFNAISPFIRSYGIQGFLKYAAAFSAIFSVFLLWRALPKALALPSPRKVSETEEDFRQEQVRLEKLLRDKNEELLRTRESLQKQVAERESALSTSEAFHHAIIENSFDLTVVLHSDGEIKYESPSLERTLGYPLGSLHGKNVFDLIHEHDHARIRKAIALRNNGASPDRTLEFRARHRDGSYRVLEAVGSFIIQNQTSDDLIVNARDITFLKQTEQELKMLPHLMHEIGEAADFHGALEVALRQVCEISGWDFGEVWISKGERNYLECSPSWYGGVEFTEFRAMSRELRFAPNMDLAGYVWETKVPHWVPDVTKEGSSHFTRMALARKVGIKAALAVPILDDSRPLAVLIFFVKQFREKETRTVHFVSTVAAQLGAVIRRKRAEDTLRRAQEHLERRVRERTKELEQMNVTLQSEIFERKNTEDTIRKSQENYLKLVNSLDGIVWEFDLRHSKYTFVSDQAERMLRYPVDAWYHDPAFWEEHIHGGDRDAAKVFRSNVALKKTDDQFEYRMVSSDGKTLWLRDMVTVVVEAGEAIKLRGVMVDITDRKQVEEALNQERNFVSAVLNTAGGLVMVLDVQGRIESFNRACEKISGFLLEEVKGKHFWEVFAATEEIERIQSIYVRLLAGQFPTNFESFWVAKDETKKVIAWTSTALLKKDGSIDHVITTGIDITQRKEAEKKLTEAVANLAFSNEELDRSTKGLTEANDRLRKMDEIKSHFISAASHELRTPLTSIKGYVDTVLEGEAGPINERQHEFLGYVKESTERLHRLLNELLDISKIESGQIKMRLSQTNIRQLLKEEIMIFKALADSKMISMKLETEDSLEDVFCDSDKIKEVMDNLLSNAIKYTMPRGKIKIDARNYRDGMIQIDIQDTGIGIKKEDLDRVFEPFQHIEKNGADIETEESTGLGLTLVKRIVEAHNGRVTVKSQEGVGSTFSVLLPVGDESSELPERSWIMSHD